MTGTVEKTYDATNAASLTAANYRLTGIIGTDAVALNNPASGTYDTPTVGTAKLVTVTGLSISGAQAGNYQLGSSSTSATVGIVDKALLTIKADNQAVVSGSPLPVLTGSVSGLKGTDSAATVLTGLSYTSPVLLSTLPGAYAIVPLASAASPNYTLVFENGVFVVKPSANDRPDSDSLGRDLDATRSESIDDLLKRLMRASGLRLGIIAGGVNTGP